MPRRPARLLALVALTAMSVDAQAAGDHGTLDVRVDVQVTCTVTASSIDFGSYISGQHNPLNAEGTVGYDDCPAGPLLLELDNGRNGKTRAMTDSGGNKITYQLYKDATRKSIWGMGTAGRIVTLTGRGGGTVPVYGSVLGAQSVPAGAYTDTVNITLSF